MDQSALVSLLESHVPAASVSYCLQLWQEHPFQLTLRTSRATKVGDFTCRNGNQPRITINADSPPFLFLITYVHEVAHLRTHHENGWTTAPHGKEWKDTFRRLCTPLLQLDVFPTELLSALERHLVNPRASSFSDAQLSKALRAFDPRHSASIILRDIPEGSQFEIRGRWFTRGKQKRTRIVCRDLHSKRNYLIAADAPVGGSS